MSTPRSPLAAAAAFALLLGAGPAAAQRPALVAVPGPNPEWVQVNQTGDGTGYIDRGSVRLENGKVRYLGRIAHGPNRHGVVEVFHIGEIDCARREFRLIGFDAFGTDRRLILSHVNSLEEYPPEAINDGSPNDDLHRQHCR